MLDLAAIDVWIFDLDNTLYHPKVNLFGQIDIRMGAYIERLLGVDAPTARVIQKRYFEDYGTTLSGLMQQHRIDPHDFLAFVHDVDLSPLAPDPGLAHSLGQLSGRKLIFTNADEAYAHQVLDRLEISTHFEAIYDIHAAAFIPKPQSEPYQQLLNKYDINPHRAIFFEDMARNLEPAKRLGMHTVWVNNGSEKGTLGSDGDHIDHEITHVSDWLRQLLPASL